MKTTRVVETPSHPQTASELRSSSFGIIAHPDDVGELRLKPVANVSLWERLQAIDSAEAGQPVLITLEPDEIDVVLAAPKGTLEHCVLLNGPNLTATPGFTRLRSIYDLYSPEQIEAHLEALTRSEAEQAQEVEARIQRALRKAALPPGEDDPDEGKGSE